MEQLSEFELGRFLIKNNGGVSGFWTYYIILGFKESKLTNPLEDFIVNKAPTVLATQQRFAIFQNLLRESIKSNSVVCSIPCGLMQDLQTLEIPSDVTGVRFIGIDLDQATMDLAKEFAKKLAVRHLCEFFQQNAWNLQEFQGQFDIITSSGLNIYEADDKKVVELYKGFYKALRPGGKLIGSALSYPPSAPEKTEWNMAQIDARNLMLQKMLFSDILQATWNHFRTSSESIQQLEAVGFTDIEIHWDTAKIFYTFEARRLATGCVKQKRVKGGNRVV